MTDALCYAFGDYVFIPRRQMLLKAGRAVRIGCRALDLLSAFVRRPGEVLTKGELLEEAWPDTTVVEGNLKVHIAALRRALDDDADCARYIATVTGRGYRFIAPVETWGPDAGPGGETDGRPLVSEPASVGPLEERFHAFISVLTQAMRSAVVDLPAADTSAGSSAPRRVLCIELTARDEAWLEHVFSQPHKAISATH